MSTNTVSLRVSDAVAKELAELAASTDRPKAWHLEQALHNYLELHAWQIRHLKKGLADLEAGRLHSHSVALKSFDRLIKNVKRKRK